LLYYGLTTFCRGMAVIFFGVMIESAGSLVKMNRLSNFLTSAGIIIFLYGLHRLVMLMDNRGCGFGKTDLASEKKKLR